MLATELEYFIFTKKLNSVRKVRDEIFYFLKQARPPGSQWQYNAVILGIHRDAAPTIRPAPFFKEGFGNPLGNFILESAVKAEDKERWAVIDRRFSDLETVFERLESKIIIY